MAHYAKIEDGVVTQVIVAHSKLWCEETLGGTWVQTSYNANFRKNYAGVGYTYDREHDVFYPPQPYPSWTISAPDWLWKAPVPYPTDGKAYKWNEETTSWQEISLPE